MAPRIPLKRDRFRRRRPRSAPVAPPARPAHERPPGHRSRTGQRARAAAVPAHRAAPLLHAHGGDHARRDGRVLGRAAVLRAPLRHAARRLAARGRPGRRRVWASACWPSCTPSSSRSLCVLASSIGVAAFHPEASKFAAWLSGERRSTAMSVFSVGGNLGVAIGPLLAGLIAAHYGLGGVWLLAIPGLAIAGVQLAGLAALGGATAHARVATALAGRDRWGATALLLVALMVRGYVHFGLLTFIPLLEHDARHTSDVVRLARARADALRRRRRHARDRPRRRPLRPPAHAHADVPDRRARRRALPRRLRGARPRRHRVRGRRDHLDVRDHHRALAGVPADAARHRRRASRSASRSASAVSPRSRSAALADSIGIVDALWTMPPAALLGAALCALLPAPDAPQPGPAVRRP